LPFVDVYAQPTPNEAYDMGFVLRTYNGFLTVFRQDNPDMPYYETDVRAATLSDYDRALLESGIYVHDKVSLQKLLDDFTT